MNSINPIFLGYPDNFLNIQVRFQRIIFRANLVRFIRLVTVQRIAVFVGINGYCAQTQFRARPQHADGNFTAVGNH